MAFKELTEPSVFIASPGDVGETRKSVSAMIEGWHKQSPGKGVKPYAWESEISTSGFDQWRPAPEQIPLPSDPLCKAVLFLFGERIGTPFIGAQSYRQYLGDDEVLQPQGCKYRLELNWEDGLEKSGGFPLTGTVFELLVTLAANEDARKLRRAYLPFMVILIADETILSAIQSETNARPEDVNWGNKELFEKGRRGLKLGDFGEWEKEYLSQIRQLRNFIRYLIQRNVPIDVHSIARSPEEANEKCKDFLVRNLGYIEKTGNPFKGLKFYDFHDDEIFFGREEWLKAALEKFDKSWSPPSAPFYGIVGGSGVGKSSLLRAGVLARLRKAGYKVAIYRDNDFLSRRGNEAVINRFSDSPLGIVVEKALHGIFEKYVVDESRADGQKITSKIEEGDKKIVSQIIDDLAHMTAERRPHKAAEKIVKALEEHAGKEKFPQFDEPRLVIGLDQFEELLDYRTAEGSDANSRLDSLFLFFQESCKSGRIGFVYTCQNNRLEQLKGDPGLVSLVDPLRQDRVEFPTAYELGEMIRQMFFHVDMSLSDSIVHELWKNVDIFAEDIRRAEPQVLSSEEIKATLLPLLSLTLLNFYEHYEKLRPELLQKQDERRKAELLQHQQEPQVKASDVFANSAHQGGETESSSDSADGAGRRGRSRIDFINNENMLFLELEDLGQDILNVENAIKVQADKALKEARESPGVLWLDEVFDALLRRLIRIHSKLDEHYSLLSIAVPRRGAGKLLVEKFRENRLLIPGGHDDVRLVHEAIITHWGEARERVAKEKRLLKAYKEKLAPLIDSWESKKRSSKFFQIVDAEDLNLAGEFLHKWRGVFAPDDGTKPSRKDQKLCDFALAALEAAMTPSGVVEADDYTSSHFLTAVTYGRRELVQQYLKIEPTAALEHRTSKGANAAYCAASGDDVSTLDIVIENGADPNEALEGWQALHVAAHNGNTEMFDRLVGHKADPNAVGFFGRTALHVAATNDRQLMVRHLLESYTVEPNVGDTDEWTALHLACQSAATESVRALLDHEATDTSLITKDGWSALNIACRHGNADIVRQLLQNPLTDPTALANGWSPLHLAILNKSPDIILSLLEDERVDRAVESPAKKGVVEHAIAEANLEVLKALLDDPFKKIDPDATSGNRGTPLFIACVEGKAELVRVLVDGGADVNAPGSQGLTPFLLAAGRGNIKILKMLLPRAHFAQRDNDGRTALHLAALKGHTHVVKTLVEYIDPSTPDDFGAIPLHLAAQAGFIRTVEIFLKFNPELVDVADGQGRKLPHIVAAQGDTQFLSEPGVDFNADSRDAQGMSALHYAARLGKVDFLKHLLERGNIDPNTRDNYGWTPLHLGAQNGHAAVVSVLLEKGADKSVPGDDPPLSPLLAAVAAGQTSIVELLIQQDAVPGDYTALLDEAVFLAVKNAQFETASTLLTLHSRNTRS
jgi:ankyrin repeat protein